MDAFSLEKKQWQIVGNLKWFNSGNFFKSIFYVEHQNAFAFTHHGCYNSLF